MNLFIQKDAEGNPKVNSDFLYTDWIIESKHPDLDYFVRDILRQSFRIFADHLHIALEVDNAKSRD